MAKLLASLEGAVVAVILDLNNNAKSSITRALIQRIQHIMHKNTYREYCLLRCLTFLLTTRSWMLPREFVRFNEWLICLISPTDKFTWDSSRWVTELSYFCSSSWLVWVWERTVLWIIMIDRFRLYNKQFIRECM